MKLYSSLSASNMSTQKTDTHVNNLLSSCWPSISSNRTMCQPEQFLLDDHKLMLEEHEIEMDSLQYDSDAEKSGGVDVFDSLILSNQSLNTELAELKPLPPFTGYTGHLSINGISGHHYHAIAHRHHISSEENNNFMTTNLNQTSSFSSTRSLSTLKSGIAGIEDPVGIGRMLEEHNIVSSSTCLPDSALYPETTNDNNTSCYQDVKLFSESGIESKMCSSMADSCAMSIPCPDSMSSVRIYADSKEQAVEFVDMSSIDDIAAIIGSAIADTTVPNQTEERDGADSRDSWMDLDAWIDGNCVPSVVSQQESLNEFILPNSPVLTSSEPPTSTLQNLLTNNYMPLLQSRLQNGPPPLKNETPTSSTPYGNDSINSTNSPPESVVSTTDNLITKCMSSSIHPHQPQQQQQQQQDEWFNNMQNTSKVKRRIKQVQQQPQQQQQPQNETIGSSLNFPNTNDMSDLLGKEKPVHRCNICNRGFLNKSNIKVHLRTHTGEKPFRCEVCAKAFRQKAHLIKHQQIHKRIGRD